MELVGKIIVGIMIIVFIYIVIDSLISVNKPKNNIKNEVKKDSLNVYKKKEETIKKNNNTRNSYKDYLKSDHWQETRKKALSRAGYKCQLCSNKNLRLNVHHNNYKNLWNETSKDLIVLCERCHAKFHNKPYKES